MQRFLCLVSDFRLWGYPVYNVIACFAGSSPFGLVLDRNPNKVVTVGQRLKIRCWKTNPNNDLGWTFKNRTLDDCPKDPRTSAAKGEVCIQEKRSSMGTFLLLQFENIQSQNGGVYTCNEYLTKKQQDLIDSTDVYVNVEEKRAPTASASTSFSYSLSALLLRVYNLCNP